MRRVLLIAIAPVGKACARGQLGGSRVGGRCNCPELLVRRQSHTAPPPQPRKQAAPSPQAKPRPPAPARSARGAARCGPGGSRPSCRRRRQGGRGRPTPPAGPRSTRKSRPPEREEELQRRVEVGAQGTLVWFHCWEQPDSARPQAALRPSSWRSPPETEARGSAPQPPHWRCRHQPQPCPAPPPWPAHLGVVLHQVGVVAVRLGHQRHERLLRAGAGWGVREGRRRCQGLRRGRRSCQGRAQPAGNVVPSHTNAVQTHAADAAQYEST